jgi:hypothetical protein
MVLLIAVLKAVSDTGSEYCSVFEIVTVNASTIRNRVIGIYLRED